MGELERKLKEETRRAVGYSRGEMGPEDQTATEPHRELTDENVTVEQPTVDTPQN